MVLPWVLIDISGTRDKALCKEVVDDEGCAADVIEGPRVLQGSRIVVTIVVADTNRDVALENRILHGPKEHTWIAGSGSRCELVELAVASMHVGERCVVACGDPALYADAGLCVEAAPSREVEYLLHLHEATPTELPASLPAMLERAETQKSAAAERLREGKTQLALLKYRILCGELEESAFPETGADAGAAAVECARHLCRVAKLNCAACLLRLERWSAACEACDDVLVYDGRNLKALFRRGQGRLRLGDASAAMQDFEAVLEIEPGNQEVKRQIAQCQRLLDKAADRARFVEERKGQVTRDKWH